MTTSSFVTGERSLPGKNTWIVPDLPTAIRGLLTAKPQTEPGSLFTRTGFDQVRPPSVERVKCRSVADRWLCSPGLRGFSAGRSAVRPRSSQTTLMAPSGPTAISGLVARRPASLTCCQGAPVGVGRSGQAGPGQRHRHQESRCLASWSLLLSRYSSRSPSHWIVWPLCSIVSLSMTPIMPRMLSPALTVDWPGLAGSPWVSTRPGLRVTTLMPWFFQRSAISCWIASRAALLVL